MVCAMARSRRWRPITRRSISKRKSEWAEDDFTKIPNGIPSLEDRVNLYFTHGVKTGRIDLHSVRRNGQHARRRKCSACFRAKARSKSAATLTSSSTIRIIAAKFRRKRIDERRLQCVRRFRDRRPAACRDRARQSRGARWRICRRIRPRQISRTRAVILHERQSRLRSRRMSIVDLDLAQSRLYNKDLAPVPASRRKWRVGSFAALWISMSACIPTYMLASSLIGGGMNWSQAILTIFLGNLIVADSDDPECARRHALRNSFPGFLPRVVRNARRKYSRADARVRRLRLVRHPDLDRRQRDLQDPRRLLFRSLGSERSRPFSASRSPQFVCFLFFWGINMLVVYKGIDCIRWLLEHQSAAAHRARACCSCGGLIKTPAASARFSRNRPRSIPASRRPASSGRSSFPRSPA